MPTLLFPRSVLAASAAIALGVAEAKAQLPLPAVFGDHMVLQRNTDAALWGRAAPGATVVVSADWPDAASATARAGADGRFRATIRTPDAGGPFTLVVATEDGSRRELRDVLVGEVWLCSGQSNMEMPLGNIGPGYEGVLGAAEVIAAADHPRLRLFTVENRLAAAPLDDCTGEWRACSPERARTFSATGYFFGSELLRALDVPIGLISADWGGTPAEAWTSADTLGRDPDFADATARVAELGRNRDALERRYDAEIAGWEQRLDELDPGSRAGHAFAAPSFDDSAWSTMPLPAAWESNGLEAFDGIVWLRRTIELPADQAGRDLVLELGPIDDLDVVWFAGVRGALAPARGRGPPPRRYPVPAAAARAGTRVIAVRVHDTGGQGGLVGTAEQLRLRRADDGSAAVPLAGDWRFAKGVAQADVPPMPRPPALDAHMPTVLFQGMIAPLVPFALRGVIWYQGESNRTRAAQYRRLFPAMIADWRRHFGRGDFPFYFVQIAPFGYQNDRGEAAALREAQMLALRVPNTGMAVTMDVGDPRDIHPKDKATVGQRLALWALARTYGRDDVVCSGPLYRAMEREPGRVRLSFDCAEGGLTTRDGAPPSQFTIAGADREFVPADAVLDGDTVVVHSDRVPEPVAVRYAWGAADQPNLQNRAGLPASSFRTDDWPIGGQGR
jgi:sialate O-acetylesterase